MRVDSCIRAALRLTENVRARDRTRRRRRRARPNGASTVSSTTMSESSPLVDEETMLKIITQPSSEGGGTSLSQCVLSLSPSLTSLFVSLQEFRSWMVEERMINPETLKKDKEKKEWAVSRAKLPRDVDCSR